MPEQKIIECPFCKAEIQCLYKPSVLQFSVSRTSAKTARVPYRTQERYEILVDKCPNCGKTKKEIAERLRVGDSMTASQAAERAKKAGLPLKF
jgi:hypothetical protein